MATPIANAAGALWHTLSRSCGQSVTYRRGEFSTVLTAVADSKQYEADNGYGVLETYECRDFLIPTSELVLDGAAVLPQKGDRIEEAREGVTYLYECMAPGVLTHYRFMCPSLLRIHTKLVGTSGA